MGLAFNRAQGPPVRRLLVERVQGRRTQSERRLARRNVSLRDAALAPRTVRAYRHAFLQLWNWLGLSPPTRVDDVRAYDTALSGFIEHCWEEGYTRGLAGNALSASIAAFPELRGGVRESWWLLNAWARVELPTRAPPLDPLLALAVIHSFLEQDDAAGAFLIALGFDCFLRTGEMMGLRISDLLFEKGGTAGAVRLAHTKSGQRNAACEALTINDPMVGRLWQLACLERPPGTHSENPVYEGGAPVFREHFRCALRRCEVEHLNYKPYSIRRGGATAFFRRTGNMPAAIERGRWATSKVARIYICDGYAMQIRLAQPRALRRRWLERAERLLRALERHSR